MDNSLPTRTTHKPRAFGWGLYGIGFFSLSQQTLMGVLVPLWAVHLHASPAQIGLSVASASILPSIYSIPLGAAIDRLGPHRILLIGALAAMAIYALFPWFTTIWVLMLLQLFAGIFQSMGWQGAQSFAAKTGHDQNRTRLMARFGSASNLGTFAGPLLVGLLASQSFLWAFAGAATWSLGLAVAAWALSRGSPGPAPSSPAKGGAWWIPRAQDFLEAGALVKNPWVLLVMAATFIRLGMYGVRSSFYPVYLHDLAVNPTGVGLLIAIGSLAGTASAAGLGWFSRRVAPGPLLILGLALGSVGQCIVPISTSFTGQIVLAAVAGMGMGLTLPVMLTVLANATPVHQRGMSVGLRNTMNRIASTIIPLGLGLLVSADGLHMSFFIMGTVLLLGVAAAYLYQRPIMSQRPGSTPPGLKRPS